jgi:hypothetical protein
VQGDGENSGQGRPSPGHVRQTTAGGTPSAPRTVQPTDVWQHIAAVVEGRVR